MQAIRFYELGFKNTTKTVCTIFKGNVFQMKFAKRTTQQHFLTKHVYAWDYQRTSTRAWNNNSTHHNVSVNLLLCHSLTTRLTPPVVLPETHQNVVHFLFQINVLTAHLSDHLKWRFVQQNAWIYVTSQHVIWANQMTESFVYHRQLAHSMIHVMCFPAFVGASDIISSVLSIC